MHTGRAGTLGRTVALVETGAAAVAVGIDEGTCLTVAGPGTDPADGVVTGAGSVWVLRPDGRDGTSVSRLKVPGTATET